MKKIKVDERERVKLRVVRKCRSDKVRFFQGKEEVFRRHRLSPRIFCVVIHVV